MDTTPVGAGGFEATSEEGDKRSGTRKGSGREEKEEVDIENDVIFVKEVRDEEIRDRVQVANPGEVD